MRRIGDSILIACASRLAPAICLLIFIGCGNAEDGGANGGTVPGEFVPVKMETSEERRGFHLVKAEESATSRSFELRWVGEAPSIGDNVSLGMVLPAGVTPRASWKGASLGGDALGIVRPAQEGDQPGGVQPTGPAVLTGEPGSFQYLGVMRHWPLYRFTFSHETFSPLRGGGADGKQAKGEYRLTMQVAWDAPPNAEAKGEAPKSKATELWRGMASALVLNPDDLDRFAMAEALWPADVPKEDTDVRRLAPSAKMWARLRAEGEGFVRLEMLELQRVGFAPAEAKPEAVRVFSHGEAVPLLIAPGPDAPAGLAPGVYFWVHGKPEDKYSKERVYWVTLAGDVPARRLAGLTAVPDAERARPLKSIPRVELRDVDEKFRTRHGRFMAFLGMAWVEAPLTAEKPLVTGIALPYFEPAEGDPQATFTFFSEKERALETINIAVTAGDVPSSIPLALMMEENLTRQVMLPSAAFRDGATSLSFHLGEAASPMAGVDDLGEPGTGLWFDKVEVKYPSLPRLIEGRLTVPTETGQSGAVWIPLPDLAGSNAPEVVAVQVGSKGEALGLWPIVAGPEGARGVTFIAEDRGRLEIFDTAKLGASARLEKGDFEDLLGPQSPAEQLIVTHAEFRAMAEALAAHQRKLGRTSRVVDVQSVYDQFSHGEFTPVAIKSLLATALHQWGEGAPAEVLLVGDCTADYLGEARNEVRNWVPSYTFLHGADTFASDYWFTLAAGGDNLGDFMLGRIPVVRREEAETVLEKIINYETTFEPGPMKARLGYIADQGEFPQVLDELRREQTPQAYGAERVYLNEYPLEDNWYLTQSLVESKDMKVSGRATEGILRMFRRGVTVLSYYGHGSPNIWSNERMWFGGGSTNSDNLMLEGNGKYSFIVNMTCNSGAIDYPLTPWNVCITEDILRIKGGGAIGCFVPSGPSVTMIHQSLSRALNHVMFEKGMRRLGEITTAAKLKYLIDGSPDDLVYMYQLLGDPSLELKLTARRGRFEPAVRSVTPGERFEVALEGIEPAAGRWVAELVNEKEETLWSGTGGEYTRGRVALSADVPTTATTGPGMLRVYCWAPGEGKDVALAAEVRIETPSVGLGEVRIAIEGDGYRAEVPVVNHASVAGAGKLEVWVEDQAGTRTLLQAEAMGGETPTVKVAREAGWSEPVTLGVRLASARMPDDPEKGQTTTRRFLVWAPEDFTGWIPRMSRMEISAASGQAELSLIGVIAADEAPTTESAGVQWMAGVDSAGGEMLGSQPAQPGFSSEEGAGVDSRRVIETILRFDGSQAAQLEEGKIWLMRQPLGEEGMEGERVASVPVSVVERRKSGLRIVPGSVRARPESPTEGETVFVDFEVENTGDANSPITSARLLESPPEEGSRLAHSRMHDGIGRIGSLAPGRRTAVRLRWDPVHNAGERPLWVELMGAPGYRPGVDPGLMQKLTVRARTKPDLRVAGKSWDASDRDRRNNRLNIHADIENRGETMARQVVVAFYRSEVQVEQNKLGEMLLPEVPALGTSRATYVWTYDPATVGQPQPTVKAWHKGSVRPPISDAPAVVEGE